MKTPTQPTLEEIGLAYVAMRDKGKAKFYSLMEQLVAYQAELKEGRLEVLALVQEIFPDKVVQWTEEYVPDRGSIIDIFGVPLDQQRESGVYDLREKIKDLIGSGCLFMFRKEDALEGAKR